MSTETIWTIRDREPRTATSTFTQLRSSDYYNSSFYNILLYMLKGELFNIKHQTFYF